MTRSTLKRSRRPIRKVSKAARARKDKAYMEWLHTQPSVVSASRLFVLGLDEHVPFEHLGPGIEVHHFTTPHRDSHAVPLYWWFHRLTSISVHGGGGNRKFQERFSVDFEAEAARLRAKYEAKTGRKVKG